MKQRHHKRRRDNTRPAPCAPTEETVPASLDEGLAETFPASDPVSVSVTRIDDSGAECETDNRTDDSPPLR